MQGPILQRRTVATWDKIIAEPENTAYSKIKRISFAPYVPDANGLLAKGDFDRNLRIALAEFKKLAPQEYGPLGRNYIVEVKIPADVQQAVDDIKGAIKTSSAEKTIGEKPLIDKKAESIIALLRQSNISAIKRAKELLAASASYETSISIIAALEDMAIANIDNPAITSPIKEILINILETDRPDVKDYVFVREMAAYALRVFSDSNVIASLKKVAQTDKTANTQPASTALPSNIQGLNLASVSDYSVEYQLVKSLLTYAPEGRLAVNPENQAIIVYSDALKQSRALQEIITTHEKGSRKFYLVNKEGIDNATLFAGLEIKGINDKNFDHIFVEQDADRVINLIAPVLMGTGIAQVRIFALAGDDLVAWSRQKIVEALIMMLKDKKLEIVSDLSKEHEAYIKEQEAVLSQA
jgi:hypothetical protein